MSTWRAVGGIFLFALPMIITSVRTWVKHAIPSSPLSLFVGITGGFYFFYALFDPYDGEKGMGFWLFIGTPIWTLTCAYQLVVNPRVSKAPLKWSLNCLLTGILLLIMFWQFDAIISFSYVPFYSEVGIGMLAFLPTLTIAVMTRSNYIFALAIIGSLAFTSVMIWAASPSVIQAVVFLFADYIVLAAFFYMVCRFRENLEVRFIRWLSTCARHTCAIETTNEDDEGDTEATEDLLPIEEAENA